MKEVTGPRVRRGNTLCAQDLDSMNIAGASEKCGPLKYTNTFVYNNADCLGKGATATVFLGRHQETGKPVAIKVFTGVASHHIDKARLREIELLRTAQHKNVMRLIACEKERVSGDDVIVMEYCQGGSVFTLLDHPQNGFGFAENEFLLFLRNITDALKYLRSQGFIHRDIKPGNILKRIEDDGSASYVVTDFGAARELGDEETFQSIYGTEEYIHPGMFQRAVLRQAGQRDFTSSVDLWSLAVTVYHVACGRLPFKAHGGRDDAATLFKITSTRERGVISGIQTEAKGPIRWSKTLPTTCRLPRALGKLLEPILARMLDGASHDLCFSAIDDLLSRQKIELFYAQRAHKLCIYAKPTDSLAHIQEMLATETDIPSANQLILVPGGTELSQLVEPVAPVQGWSPAVLRNNIFLYDRKANGTQTMLTLELPSFPEIKPPPGSYPTGGMLVKHATEARLCSAYAFFVEEMASLVIGMQQSMLESLDALFKNILNAIIPIQTSVPLLESLVSHIALRLDSLTLSQENLKMILSLLTTLELPRQPSGEQNKPIAPLSASNMAFKGATGMVCPDDSIRGLVEKTVVRVNEIDVYLTVLLEKLHEHGHIRDIQMCQPDDNCLSRIENIRQKIYGVFTMLVKHKRFGSLHPHEAFVHNTERRFLQEQCGTLISLYQGHCLHNLSQLHTKLARQISYLLKHKTRTGKVDSNVQCVTKSQQQLKEELEQLDAQYKQVSKEIQLAIQEHLRQSLTSCQVSSVREDANGAADSAYASRSVSEQKSIAGKMSTFEEMSTLDEMSKTEENHIKKQAGADINMDKIKTRHSDLQKLFEGISSLQTDTSKIDSMVKETTDYLRNLKSQLEGGASLNVGSFSPPNSASNIEVEIIAPR